jgi:endonuclease YncB( thermonuclease family)
MKYEVSGIVPKQYEIEIAGGDAETIKCFRQKSKAFAHAKSQSKNPKWWEVQVRQTDKYGELQGHWYFKNGKLTTDMSI